MIAYILIVIALGVFLGITMNLLKRLGFSFNTRMVFSVFAVTLVFLFRKYLFVVVSELLWGPY